MEVSIDAPDAETMADRLWNALNEENKVSLFVRYIDLRNGFAQTVVKNKYGENWSETPKAPVWNT